MIINYEVIGECNLPQLWYTWLKFKFSVSLNIVNRGDWLQRPANIKGANKDFKIYAERSMTVHNLLFFAHTLCMNYVTKTFLLVSSSVSSKQQLCIVHGQDRKTEQKNTAKNFVGFHNHSPLLTMVWSVSGLLVCNLQEGLNGVNR